MLGTDISIDDLFGNFSLIIAFGLNGAPGIVTAAVIEIEKGVEQQATPMGIIKATPWALLFMLIFALIVSIFVKKNEPVSDRMN